MSEPKKLDAHLFICTNVRESGKRESCGAKGSAELRSACKKMAGQTERGWRGRVRVNASGCLDRCEEGIVAVLYPEGKWLTHLTQDDLPRLEAALKETLDRKETKED